MAWTNTSRKNILVKTEAKTLPGSATTEYSSVIDDLLPNMANETRTITIVMTASAISGTNADIGLYGAATPTGTKYLLLDAVVADVTNAAKVKIGTVDLNDYPAPYYFIGWTSDADESANTITAQVFAAVS